MEGKGRRVNLEEKNLFVFKMKFCTAKEILKLVWKYSGSNLFIPSVRILYFSFLLSCMKNGIKYSARLKRVWRSVE